MDPITALGLALSVAGLAGQVFTGCIQGIQFIITAKNIPEDSKYLNLRLRMEQQRLFAWSETSGLLDLENKNDQKIRESKTFIIHRTTILDLLVQIQCLFKDFEKAQKKNKRLLVAPEPASDDEFIEDPGKDSSSAHVPLPESRRKFIMKAMKAVKNTTEMAKEGKRRLLWAAFDKEGFEALLQRFSTLNDNMTDILDAQLQTEIHRTTQDTNRGVLQLHKDLHSLQQLVMALNIKMEARTFPEPLLPAYGAADDASGIRLLSQLAKFKAFNESMDTDGSTPLDEATVMVLQLGKPNAEKASTKIDRSKIQLNPRTAATDITAIRCEALYLHSGIKQPVWIEWKEYDSQSPGSPSPPPLIVSRVQKLAALLHHKPKPEAFRVPHCLGYFDNASHPTSPRPASPDSEVEEDYSDPRIGFVFEKPHDEGVSPNTPPISLFQLLTSHQKPRITDRIKLAHAVANCLLYLHSVNWLHKGLRSHNIVFFSVTVPSSSSKSTMKIDYSKPYLSGFDFARPARADEATEVPGDDPEYNMYRHPLTQGIGFGPRESFRKSFDIYSLGVVLVELAYWRPIDRILGIEKGKAKAKFVREMLLKDEMISSVGAEMGEVFEDAMRICVKGGEELGIGEGEDEMGDGVAGRLGMKFYEDIVKRLGDVRV